MNNPKVETYQDKVLRYLKTGHSLDLPKAIALFGICRLSAAVWELRKKGYDIRTLQVKGPEGNEFSIYTLPKKIDKDTRIGSRVVVVKSCVDTEFRGKAGVLVRNDGDLIRPLWVLLDGDGEESCFDINELKPEYLHA
jgi:hypothetical protein